MRLKRRAYYENNHFIVSDKYLFNEDLSFEIIADRNEIELSWKIRIENENNVLEIHDDISNILRTISLVISKNALKQDSFVMFNDFKCTVLNHKELSKTQIKIEYNNFEFYFQFEDLKEIIDDFEDIANIIDKLKSIELLNKNKNKK